MSLFRQAYMDIRIPLSPTEFREAAPDIDAYLTKKLRKRLEEKCCVHGYVRRGSTQILARSMGQAEHCRFTGDFIYVCKVRVLSFLPEAGQVVDAQVLKVNKGGAYALVVDVGRVSEAVRIFVPRDLHIGNTEFDSLEEEQVIRVRLLGSRFQANDPFIQAVGTFEGMSKAEVKVPARKGALEPAVAPTERVGPAEEEGAGAETESEETEESSAYVTETRSNGGFTISRKETAAPAPAAPSKANFAKTLAAAAAAPASPAPAAAAPAPSKTNFASILAAAAAAIVPGQAPAEEGSNTNSGSEETNTKTNTNTNSGSEEEATASESS